MKLNILKYSKSIGLFFIFTGISYFIFDKFFPVQGSSDIQSPTTTQNTDVQNETQYGSFSGPKTEACPLIGSLHTKEEQEIWAQRRPLLVMIENHSDSRPQSGLQNADIVYEAVAEGGITRFMGVYYCTALKGAEQKYDVGPVRSARSYFVDIASEYGDYPLYTHVGGANCSAPKDPVTGKQSGPCTTNTKAQAIEQIAGYGWNNKGTWGDLSEFSLSYRVCRREPERTGDVRATEHTMYCSTQQLWQTAQDRGLTNLTIANKNSWDKNFKSWNFKGVDTPNSAPSTPAISFDFWPGDKYYSVTWKYDQSTNSYLRLNNSQPHIDFNTQKQLSTKNIIVQYVKETRSIDEHKHNLYEVVGSGTGVFYNNGSRTNITWSKANRISRTIYKDSSGKEVNFVPGTVWIELLPIGSQVVYEGSNQS